MARITLSLTALMVSSVAFAFHYQINGSATDSLYYGKTFYLYDISVPKQNNLPVKIDSCLCSSDGVFRFSGEYDKENLAVIGVPYKIDGGSRTDYIGTLVMAEGTTDMDMQQRAPLNGSDVNQSLRDLIIGINQEMIALREKEITFDTFKNHVENICRNVVDDNPDNSAGRYALFYLSNLIDNKAWYEYYCSLSPYLKEFTPVAELAERIENAMRTEIGIPFIDIKGVDSNGDEVSLSDYSGNGVATIVDFWASWCGPCIEEIRTTIKPLYEKYGRTGKVNIVGIGVNDSAGNMLESINRYGISWPQIMNPTVSPGEIYGFNAIPFLMVIGPEGTILARNIRGAELISFVDSLVGE